MPKAERIKLQCQFCNTLFIRALYTGYEEFTCPKCGEHDVLPVVFFGTNKPAAYDWLPT